MRYGNAAKRETLCLQSICWLLHHCLRYSWENYFLFRLLVRIKVLLPPFIWFISTILFGLFINVINVWLLINYSPWALFDITCKKKLPYIDILWRKKFMKQWTSSSIYSWNIIVESIGRNVALHYNISSLLEYIMNIIMNIMNIIFYLWTSY